MSKYVIYDKTQAEALIKDPPEQLFTSTIPFSLKSPDKNFEDSIKQTVPDPVKTAETRNVPDGQTSRHEQVPSTEVHRAAHRLTCKWLKFSSRTVLYIHLVFTLILLILKIMVAYFSGSMSIRSLVADSAVDFINIGLLLGASFLSGPPSKKYPLGRANLETLANFTMSLFMTSILLLVIYQSVIKLVEKYKYFYSNGPDPQKADISLSSVIIVVALIIIKFFLLCICCINRNAQTKVLIKDHVVDIIMNFCALVMGGIGSLVIRANWPKKLIVIDDFGGIILASFGICIWLPQIVKHAKRACHPVVENPGISKKIRNTAEKELRKIIQSNEDIALGETIIYHDGGDKIIIMQMMVLPDGMPHSRVKQIFTGLKRKLKKIDNVARVIVHWDNS